MSNTNPTTNNQTLLAAKSWLRDYHTLGDELNPDIAVPKFYTPDCEMRFPGHAPIKGHEAIISFFKEQSTILESMKHTIGHVDVLPDRIYQEATIDYVLKGDEEKKVVSVQGMAIFGKRVDEDKMRFFTVYLDTSPLVERVRVVTGAREK
ncbi:hypothetical protein BO79DRAFT_65280 [Aspergillus costaricaensis CBS 115574]|uniref:Uncharacterized protein n=1 Tax=Aspergillus costaricaensis CBS 115574 TaxID=1448317 RepID=A0ACD1IPX4_9EURO|nr:hypothetical protein BO79DRAFT_65280 [Aspergillus costaricaensis CBS 115574]RAK92477.1 hypothetical protein BO79DRAFT_65280 [Aspergillus costaricaensis CBS 115574]